MRALGSSAILLFICLAGAEARAAQGETALALELGPELAGGQAAGRLGATAWFGQGRWFWLQAGASGQLTEEGRPGFELEGGGVAALDVLRWVPWVELGAGAGRASGRTGFLVRGGLGVDYLVGPNWALGLAVRGRGIFQTASQGLGSVEIRFVRRFGF